MRACFPASPIHTGELNDTDLRGFFSAAVLDGNVNDDASFGALSSEGGAGHGVNSYDRDHPLAPDIANNNITADGIEFGSGGGAPTNPWVPPLTSPGPGSLNASDQPAFTGILKDPATNSEFGTGLGGLASPSDTTPGISSQNVVIGSLISGRSYAGSGG
jgi:hypothetical protein